MIASANLKMMWQKHKEIILLLFYSKHPSYKQNNKFIMKPYGLKVVPLTHPV